MAKRSNIKVKQLLLILAGVVVLALILLAPERKSGLSEAADLHASTQEQDHLHEGEGGNNERNVPVNKLEPETQELLTSLESQAEKVVEVETKLSLYDSLIALSIKSSVPSLVARYSRKKAEAVSTENNWLLAGDNYYKAFRLSKQQSKSMVEGAVECYEKVLEINPDNLKAKTAMGVAYVEASSLLGVMPMKGIGILKEVINIDPQNIDALTNLGYFAIQSGQYEKAVNRFETILQIDPQNAEAYIYLTDIYLSQNQVEKGIETLEKYKSLVKDPLVKKQVDDYIKEIENSNKI